MTTNPKHPGGRPPKYPAEGGRQQPYTVYLTPTLRDQVLAHGKTVSEGVNRILRNAKINQEQRNENDA